MGRRLSRENSCFIVKAYGCILSYWDSAKTSNNGFAYLTNMRHVFVSKTELQHFCFGKPHNRVYFQFNKFNPSAL